MKTLVEPVTGAENTEKEEPEQLYISVPIDSDVIEGRRRMQCFSIITVKGIREQLVNAREIADVLSAIVDEQWTWKVKPLRDGRFIVAFPSTELARQAESKGSLHQFSFSLKLEPWTTDLGNIGKPEGPSRWVVVKQLPMDYWSQDMVARLLKSAGDLIYISSQSRDHGDDLLVLLRVRRPRRLPSNITCSMGHRKYNYQLELAKGRQAGATESKAIWLERDFNAQGDARTKPSLGGAHTQSHYGNAVDHLVPAERTQLTPQATIGPTTITKRGPLPTPLELYSATRLPQEADQFQAAEAQLVHNPTPLSTNVMVNDDAYQSKSPMRPSNYIKAHFNPKDKNTRPLNDGLMIDLSEASLKKIGNTWNLITEEAWQLITAGRLSTSTPPDPTGTGPTLTMRREALEAITTNCDSTLVLPRRRKRPRKDQSLEAPTMTKEKQIPPAREQRSTRGNKYRSGIVDHPNLTTVPITLSHMTDKDLIAEALQVGVLLDHPDGNAEQVINHLRSREAESGAGIQEGSQTLIPHNIQPQGQGTVSP
ncbi:hypothetical protein J5N97_024573 [Dioscorea zingiberensis]|uniref:DUF4283 domain-containing protein n=1 Tax=Dioscorea zingiberensis TaxID=325984 RepID=A0A9D5C6Z7_9LILI|nr:hypothetical protein J5N97_024573 [Dioscorea zingiberensis]